jgi:carboxymethylenebutenolidase
MTSSGTGVVLVHDRYGWLPHLDRLAAELRADGHAATAVDLYHGRSTLDDEMARRLLDELAVADAEATIVEAAGALREGGAERIALVGFSIGGWLSLLVAADEPVESVIAYYASLEDSEFSPVPAHVQLHLAEVDDWDPPDQPQRFARRLAAAGTSAEVHLYPGTAHGFANADHRRLYVAAAAELAWTRTRRFIGANPGGDGAA